MIFKNITCTKPAKEYNVDVTVDHLCANASQFSSSHSNYENLSLFDGYFQFIHLPGSEQTISPINLLFATDVHQRNQKEKDALNFFETINYGTVFMRRRFLYLTRITKAYRGFL